MSEPGDLTACPICEKAVVGHTALLGHLEFSHEVIDGEAFLQSLGDPEPVRSWGPIIRWGAIALGAVLGIALVATVLLGGADDGATPVAAAGTASSTTQPESDESGDQTTTTTSTVPPTTAAPTTTTPPTTTSTTTSTVPPERDPVDAADFRKPFVTGAAVASCTSDGTTDRYTVAFTFSGAREIVLDGVGFPGDSGDGDHEIEHEAPAGSTGYLDHVNVADGAGDVQRADITPPLYLGGC